MEIRKILLAGAVIAATAASSLVFAEDVKESGNAAQEHHVWHHNGGMKALLSQLPEDKQELLHDTMEKIRKENASLHEQSRKLGEEIDAAMKAAEFDKGTYLAKHKQLNALHDKMKANAEKEFAAIIGQFTMEERKILVEMRHLREHHGFYQGDVQKNEMKSEDKTDK